jgi:hypothetical protein
MRFDREMLHENRMIIGFLVIIVIMLIIAGYGYFSGAWDQPLPQ